MQEKLEKRSVTKFFSDLTLLKKIVLVISASNFKTFSRSLEQFFLTVGQNNFRNKIPNRQTFFHSCGEQFGPYPRHSAVVGK